MTTRDATPQTLTGILKDAQPGDTILLKPGEYAGSFGTPTAGRPDAPITVQAEPGAVFLGAKATPLTWTVNAPYWRLIGFEIQPIAPPKSGDKPTWIAVRSGGVGAQLINLILDRPGDIADAKAHNDYGVVVEADATLVNHCRLMGMTKGVHVKGRNHGVTIVHNRIGPTYQSSIVMGTSFGAVRACLIGWNQLEDSYIEDAIQFMQDFGAADPTTDVSNIGTIIYGNRIGRMNENAIDAKGAGRIVIEGNYIFGTAGSNDGPLDGWNLRAMASITRGANTETGFALIRNNLITESAAGIRQFPHWVVVHNEIYDNNWWPGGEHTTGYGIRQVAGHHGTVVKNNLVYGHHGGDLLLYDNTDASHNADQPGADGGPLTATREAGDGLVLSLRDARYFTDWFGRKDIPPDQIFVGETFAQVVGVDYDRHTVTIDRPLAWSKDTPVFWRNPRPNVGVVSPYEETGPIVVEPPTVEPEPEPVEPPAQEVLTVRGSPASVAMLRAVLTTLGDLSISD